jgi:fatty acid desaturase
MRCERVVEARAVAMSGPDLLRACSLTASAIGDRPRADRFVDVHRLGSRRPNQGHCYLHSEFSGATARLGNQPFTSTFTELAQAIRRKGLQSRRPGFYLMIFAVLVLALAGSATGMILLKDSWLQLLLAGALGVIFTQFAFLGHEAIHRQIFQSGQANDRAGQVLAALVGLSHGWWMNKHSRHHANPNKIGKDPDIESDTVAFLDESAATRSGVRAWFTRRQGYLFFPCCCSKGSICTLRRSPA